MGLFLSKTKGHLVFQLLLPKVVQLLGKYLLGKTFLGRNFLVNPRISNLPKIKDPKELLLLQYKEVYPLVKQLLDKYFLGKAFLMPKTFLGKDFELGKIFRDPFALGKNPNHPRKQDLPFQKRWMKMEIHCPWVLELHMTLNLTHYSIPMVDLAQMAKVSLGIHPMELDKPQEFYQPLPLDLTLTQSLDLELHLLM